MGKISHCFDEELPVNWHTDTPITRMVARFVVSTVFLNGVFFNDDDDDGILLKLQ